MILAKVRGQTTINSVLIRAAADAAHAGARTSLAPRYDSCIHRAARSR